MSDISCNFLSFLSDTSSCVGHILHFFVIFVGHIWLCRTYLAVFCNFCRTHLALSDISCFLLQLLSDTSSCVGHILHFFSFLSDISGSVGHILRFVVIFVGHI